MGSPQAYNLIAQRLLLDRPRLDITRSPHAYYWIAPFLGIIGSPHPYRWIAPPTIHAYVYVGRYSSPADSTLANPKSMLVAITNCLWDVFRGC